jgi:hypothetical protein
MCLNLALCNLPIALMHVSAAVQLRAVPFSNLRAWRVPNLCNRSLGERRCIGPPGSALTRARAAQAASLEADRDYAAGEAVAMDYGAGKLDSQVLLDHGVLDAETLQARGRQNLQGKGRVGRSKC